MLTRTLRGLMQFIDAVGAYGLNYVWTDCLQEHGRVPPEVKERKT
jgi:hypothetical protein